MRYTLLIYSDQTAWNATSEAEQSAILEEYLAFTKLVTDSGEYVGGEALQPAETASTVRVNGGRPVTTDGPFAETKEILGGFYLVDVASRERAEELAAQIPDAAHGLGSVEVRPIMEFPSPDA
jgi:hypothetical protein